MADLVFLDLIVNELYENNCLGEKTGKTLDKFKPHVRNNENLKEICLDWTMNLDDYHRALGWIKEN